MSTTIQDLFELKAFYEQEFEEAREERKPNIRAKIDVVSKAIVKLGD